MLLPYIELLSSTSINDDHIRSPANNARLNISTSSSTNSRQEVPGRLSAQTSVFVWLPRQQGQWHCPVIVLTARVPVGWRRVMRVFHYGRDGWVRLADADRQQMCKVGGWFVKGSTASQRRRRAMAGVRVGERAGGAKLRWGTLSVMLHSCHHKVKVSSCSRRSQRGSRCSAAASKFGETFHRPDLMPNFYFFGKHCI